ncbi:hypothetical protein ACOZE3_20495 [Streptomyces cinereoruber]|uniref:hypothetical protein n=1 Tax=Streptomyces cinereoruber TaxID=67260 RepID=UPI003BF5264C
MLNDAATISNTCLSDVLRTPGLGGLAKMCGAPTLAAQEPLAEGGLAETPMLGRRRLLPIVSE